MEWDYEDFIKMKQSINEIIPLKMRGENKIK